MIVKLDIRGFYPTVTMRRVKGLLRRAGLGEQVATLMALLATESPREEVVTHGKTHFVALGPRSLPQGAPTSPSITNALCLRLDCRLSGLARKLGGRYTRYADDLTFGLYWQPGDPFVGDPPHELQGWYSIYNTDKSTLGIVKRFTGLMSALDRRHRDDR